jgi:uncharacterized phage-associated protein
MADVKFAFNDAKAVEVLAYIVSEWDGISPFYVSKVLFFAEKEHLNAYGRPIIGDTYIAMDEGPVPSAIRDYINHNFRSIEKPAELDQAVKIEKGKYYRKLHPGQRKPDMAKLSATDVEEIKKAINFCRGKSRSYLSKITHFEKAWAEAPSNRAMKYENFIDDKNPHRDEILEETKEFAVNGVL